MELKHSKLQNLLIMLFVLFAAYIQNTSASVLISFVVCALLTAMFEGCTNKKVIIFSVFGFVCSFALYWFNTEIHDIKSMVYMLISYFNVFVPSIILSYCLKHKFSLANTIKYTAGGYTFITLMSLAEIKYIEKINMSDMMKEHIENAFALSLDMLHATTDFTPNDITHIEKALAMINDIMIMLMPCMYIILHIILSYILIVSVKSILKHCFKKEHNHIECFYQIYAGRTLSNITIILLLLSMFYASNLFVGGVYNFSLIAAFIYSVTGISVVSFYMIKLTKSKSSGYFLTLIIMIFSLISLCVMPAFNGGTVLFFIGLLDSSRNFRKLKKAGA